MLTSSTLDCRRLRGEVYWYVVSASLDTTVRTQQQSPGRRTYSRLVSSIGGIGGAGMPVHECSHIAVSVTVLHRRSAYQGSHLYAPRNTHDCLWFDVGEVVWNQVPDLNLHTRPEGECQRKGRRNFVVGGSQHALIHGFIDKDQSQSCSTRSSRSMAHHRI